jgi:hypothetical protein
MSDYWVPMDLPLPPVSCSCGRLFVTIMKLGKEKSHLRLCCKCVFEQYKSTE